MALFACLDGIDSTPTIRIRSQVLVGAPSWDQFSAVIEAELEAAAGRLNLAPLTNWRPPRAADLEPPTGSR